jgi:hypothetical protein
VVVEAAGEAERDQGVQHLLHVIARGAPEALRQILEIGGASAGARAVAR